MVKKRDESRITRFLAWALGGRLNTEQLLHVGKFLKAETRFRKVTCQSLRQPHKLHFCVDILNVFPSLFSTALLSKSKCSLDL